MKKRVIMKIILTMLITALVVLTFGEVLFVRAENSNFSLDGFEDKSNTSIDKPVSKISGVILGVIRIIGLGVSIIMITYVAMKYMLAAPSDRADLKKTSIQYVIGAIVVFGATNILQVIIDVVQAAFPS